MENTINIKVLVDGTNAMKVYMGETELKGVREIRLLQIPGEIPRLIVIRNSSSNFVMKNATFAFFLYEIVIILRDVFCLFRMIFHIASVTSTTRACLFSRFLCW